MYSIKVSLLRLKPLYSISLYTVYSSTVQYSTVECNRQFVGIGGGIVVNLVPPFKSNNGISPESNILLSDGFVLCYCCIPYRQHQTSNTQAA